MGQVFGFVVGIACVGVFIWLFFVPRQDGASSSSDGLSADDPEIGTLIGLTGGSIEDAAIARFALRRFEEEHGRKPTAQEMGIVAGMMRELRNSSNLK